LTDGLGTKTVTINQSAGQSAPAASQSAPPVGQSAPRPERPRRNTERCGHQHKSGSAGESNAPVPNYQPGSVASKSQHNTVLTSPDSVSTIGSYYQDVLAKGGWQLRSSSSTPYSASFTHTAPTRA
jgi:hypothetical protein